MSEQRQQATSWTRRRDEKKRRMQEVMRWMSGPILPTDKTVEALEALVVAGDRIEAVGSTAPEGANCCPPMMIMIGRKPAGSGATKTGTNGRSAR